MAQTYFPSGLVSYLWEKVKEYVQENAEPRKSLPNFYLDPETMTLYISKSSGYDFYVDPETKVLYYKERSS